MKKIVYLLLFTSIIKMISGQCYTEGPTDPKSCDSKKRDGYRCCYIKYRNDRDPEYKTLCVEVIKKDIKSGRHEQTILDIEAGNYTGSNWSETLMNKFRNYSSVNDFDCKGTFISKSLIILSSLLIIILLL